jgi:glycine dehydrogenase
MAHAFDPTDFSRRHIGPSPDDVEEMLATVGASSLDALIDETLPRAIRQRTSLALGRPLSEAEALNKLRATAGKNRVLTSLIGQGYCGSVLPGVIQRNVLENPAWYTAYTPYQAEISQGRLEALINFQTMVADLTALDVANASLLDEATAAAEAMAMARRSASSKGNAIFVDADCHPQTIDVVRTRAEPFGFAVIVGDPLAELDPTAVFGALLQYPGSSGEIRDFRPCISALHAAGALAVMAADPLALTLLIPPGELGADIAVGSTQRFGLPMGFGGPHAAYIATRDAFKRALPGRLVGVSIDRTGTPAYRLALQTREQHIRREKATSNICTAEVLPAVVASMYAVYHGPEGLKTIARRVHRTSATLAAGLAELGWPVATKHFFDTVTIAVAQQQTRIIERALAAGINLRRIGDDAIGVSCDETTTLETIEDVCRGFGSARDAQADGPSPLIPAKAGNQDRVADSRPRLDSRFRGNERNESTQDFFTPTPEVLPASLRRASPFLMHAVFHQHRSETEMLRYMRRLADRDLALDRTMIPLGSCTMKLNATAEMMPITWPQFADIHPFTPADQAQGYAELIGDLGAKLCAITGYDAISFEPNSGAQGEYAGLLAIRAYHRSRGEARRNVCLIPSSAHGTNPASAQMAGMRVVVVDCDADGNIDLADLTAKADQHAEALAAVMITYPSTHGVFEEAIGEICAVVHARGGQVYLDGANLNAQVGLAQPGHYGADVSHLNLHKTFCIPHGGGGPGMGPIGVRAHLKPFLPSRPGSTAERGPVGPVSAAPFGSGSILPVSWAYIAMMGAEGLTAASKVAILNANYIARRLEAHYPVLYKGAHGRVAHECIIDTRGFKDSAGITVDDIAKRLIDYGFHAPTMSFPVTGTLMIEPTESESKAELDRFCDAMIAIRNEIREIESGRWDAAASPLRFAPHTAHDLAADRWDRPYTRAQGCFPASRVDKYWPPVGRIDNAYGDRHLMCTCPPPAAYEEAAE